VGVEGGAVLGVLGGEGGHPHRFRIAYLVEHGVEVGVFDRSQCYFSHGFPETRPASFSG
jgi:hypothetical protein